MRTLLTLIILEFSGHYYVFSNENHLNVAQINKDNIFYFTQQ